jgi:hypothetical protein
MDDIEEDYIEAAYFEFLGYACTVHSIKAIPSSPRSSRTLESSPTAALCLVCTVYSHIFSSILLAPCCYRRARRTSDSLFTSESLRVAIVVPPKERQRAAPVFHESFERLPSDGPTVGPSTVPLFIYRPISAPDNSCATSELNSPGLGVDVSAFISCICTSDPVVLSMGWYFCLPP